MNQFCPNPQNDCVDPANPVTNFSSEVPDQEIFIGRSYSKDPPPLGGIWFASSCVGRIQSTVSQQDADDRAAQAAVTCLPYVTPVENPDRDPGEPPFIYVPVQTYTNDEQTCDFTCVDGSVYTYTIPAGTVTAFSLAAANAQAASLACNRNIDTRICIGELSAATVCLGDFYDETVTFTLMNPPSIVTIVSGSLPPGVTLSYDDTSFTLTGTVGATGANTFTVQVEDFDGNFMQKTFTIQVATIANTTLADGTIGVAYSETLVYNGSVNGNVHWAVTAGALPAGLSLNTLTGVISGTPTTQASYTFTVTMTDGF